MSFSNTRPPAYRRFAVVCPGWRSIRGVMREHEVSAGKTGSELILGGGWRTSASSGDRVARVVPVSVTEIEVNL
ncbi:hypothetical protein AB0C84_43870 [Actinomadura sp. NPDC048955]|uniref:hypothetical protein n=1 Tax=Actinomadura sp. NPDC048955 TaxID=3158228 RepID=UPI003407DAE0